MPLHTNSIPQGMKSPRCISLGAGIQTAILVGGCGLSMEWCAQEDPADIKSRSGQLFPRSRRMERSVYMFFCTLDP